MLSDCSNSAIHLSYRGRIHCVIQICVIMYICIRQHLITGATYCKIIVKLLIPIYQIGGWVLNPSIYLLWDLHVKVKQVYFHVEMWFIAEMQVFRQRGRTRINTTSVTMNTFMWTKSISDLHWSKNHLNARVMSLSLSLFHPNPT